MPGGFMNACKEYGMDQLQNRKLILRKAAAQWIEAEAMLFIAGYDYISAPNDNKYRGLHELFFTANGELKDAINFKSWSFYSVVYDMANGFQAGSPQNIGVMSKILNFVSFNIQTHGSMGNALASSVTADEGRYNQAVAGLSANFSPYWGGEIARLGLTAKNMVSKATAAPKTVNQFSWGMAKMGMQTRARGSNVMYR